jgi:glutamyl-tRNA reductase
MKENNITVRDRLFIDLAVPPDIDPEAVTLTGGRLTAIDNFERLARENNQVRQNSVEVAMSIIDKYTDELFKDTALHSFMPYMAELAEKYEKSGFEKLVYKLRADLTADQFRAVLKSLKEM